MFDTRQLEGGITCGEWRHLTRRVLGETQAFMANRMGISRAAYLKLEADPLPFKPSKGDSITINEVLYLCRRRAGMSQKQVAKALGRSEFWTREMENGNQDCHELAEFWKKPGPPLLEYLVKTS